MIRDPDGGIPRIHILSLKTSLLTVDITPGIRTMGCSGFNPRACMISPTRNSRPSLFNFQGSGIWLLSLVHSDSKLAQSSSGKLGRSYWSSSSWRCEWYGDVMNTQSTAPTTQNWMDSVTIRLFIRRISYIGHLEGKELFVRSRMNASNCGVSWKHEALNKSSAYVMVSYDIMFIKRGAVIRGCIIFRFLTRNFRTWLLCLASSSEDHSDAINEVWSARRNRRSVLCGLLTANVDSAASLDEFRARTTSITTYSFCTIYVYVLTYSIPTSLWKTSCSIVCESWPSMVNWASDFSFSCYFIQTTRDKSCIFHDFVPNVERSIPPLAACFQSPQSANSALIHSQDAT